MEPMRPSTVRPAGFRRAGTERPWAVAAERVAADLGTDPVAGLAPEEAASRLTQFGENVLVEQGRKPAWRLLAEQFASTVVVVLLVAAVVAAALGDLKDTLVILAILVLNGLLGFVQEYRAEQAMVALKAMTAPVVRVRRGGRVRELPAAEVVPGDLDASTIGAGKAAMAAEGLRPCLGVVHGLARDRPGLARSQMKMSAAQRR
jgi:magnesium-transporting ATPase (P-type)